MTRVHKDFSEIRLVLENIIDSTHDMIGSGYNDGDSHPVAVNARLLVAINNVEYAAKKNNMHTLASELENLDFTIYHELADDYSFANFDEYFGSGTKMAIRNFFTKRGIKIDLR